MNGTDKKLRLESGLELVTPSRPKLVDCGSNGVLEFRMHPLTTAEALGKC